MLQLKNKLSLGTANFGDKISYTEAERIMESFLQNYVSIHTATNYPITNRSTFGSTLNFIKTFLDKHSLTCNLTVNIGALSSQYSSQNDLTPTFFYANYLMLKEMFPNQKLTLAVHWDDQSTSRADLVDLFCEIKNQVGIGLSGVKFPSNYLSNIMHYEYQVNSYLDKKVNYDISNSVKNVLAISKMIGYQLLGGNKLSHERTRVISDLYSFSNSKDLEYAVLKNNSRIYDQMIIGPRDVNQTLSWIKAMEILDED